MSDEALPAARIADARQAALLLDVELRMMIVPLMKRACSAAELSRELGVGLQRAHYLLGKLHTVGVAELDSVQPRAGRAVKRYRISARWFVPFGVTGADTLGTFLEAQLLPRMQQFLSLSVRQLEAGGDGAWGYWLEQHGESSSLRIGNAQGAALELFAGDEPLLLNLGTLHLRPEQASALKRRLLAVMEEFEPLHDPRQPPYTVGLLLARGEVG